MEKKILIKPCTKYIFDLFNSMLSHNKILFKLRNGNDLKDEDVQLIQEAIILKQVTVWEIFIYKLLTYCISIDTSKLSEYIGVNLPRTISLDNAQAIINGVNYTSISDTTDLKLVFENFTSEENNPMEQFLPPMLRYVDEMYLLRNYIAHKSHVSKAKISKMYFKNYGIVDFIKPGFFLNTLRDFEFGHAQTAEHYYFVLQQISIFCWRLLDKPSYEKIFMKDNPTEVSSIGYVNMSYFLDNN